MYKLRVNLILLTLLLAPLVAFGQLDIFSPLTSEEDNANDFPLYLVWKAHTNVPGFYEGKPLAVPGSAVSVVAFTPTQNLDLLTFYWETDDASLGGQGAEMTGVGKNC